MARIASDDIRERILTVAEQRFWNFGFKKTTIDEIAAEVGVGKGTIYQYFESKGDIVVATVFARKQRLLNEQAVIAYDAQLAPDEKLRRVIKLPILALHRLAEQFPYGHDMLLTVHTQIPQILQGQVDQEIRLFAEILNEGQRMQLFTFPDATSTAWTFHHMTYGFWPPFSTVQGTAQVNEELDRLIDLVLRGLT
jgi:AcrR family transcriptional regulator